MVTGWGNSTLELSGDHRGLRVHPGALVPECGRPVMAGGGRLPAAGFCALSRHRPEVSSPPLGSRGGADP